MVDRVMWGIHPKIDMRINCGRMNAVINVHISEGVIIT